MAGITSTKKIKGQPHLLAYITPNEVKKLKALGGQETMTPEGIPAYPEFDNYTESSLAGTSSAGSGMSRSEFEGGAYSGTGSAGDGVINQYNTSSKAPVIPKKKPPKTKDNYRTNFVEDYFNYSIPTTIMNNIAKSKFVTNLNAKRREKYINDLLETDPDEYNRIMGDLSKVNMIVGPQVIGSTQIGPQVKTDYGMPKAPPSMLTSNFEVIDGRKSLGDPSALEILGQKYKDTLTFDQNTGGDGIEPYIPINYNTGVTLPIDDVEEEKTYDYRFGNPNTNQALDVTLAQYFNQGGRVPRAFGGIMDTATGRKKYFLGSVGDAIGDVVGSVADAAGKVLKSDLGKAAIIGAGIYYGGGGRMPFTDAFKSQGFGGFSLGPSTGGFFSKQNPLLFSSKMVDGVSKQVFNPLKFAGLTTLGGFLAGPAKVDQMPGDDGSRGGRLIDPLTGEEGTPASMRANIENAKIEAAGDPVKLAALNQKYNNMLFSILPYENYGNYAQGGRIRAEEGGLMNLGGMEKDYRNEGGFVAIGKQEKADDVPARLSVNEFVFTADAVRNAGGGDIDKGAEVMENMMKNLENGGRVSEESQGNAGAQQMFSVSERIGEVI